MALAIRFEQLIGEGQVSDYAELARLGHVSRARITQIMNLRLLAPDIQEQLLWLSPIERGSDPLHLRQLQPPPGLDKLLARLENDASEREPAELTKTLIAHGAQPTSVALPVCQGYGSYVQDCAFAGLLDGVDAVFAVEASYHDSWRAVRASVPADSPWREWVENWSGPEFGAVVTGLGQYLDELAGDPPQPVRDRLKAIVRGVARWELRFWDMCWTGDGQVRQDTQP